MTERILDHVKTRDLKAIVFDVEGTLVDAVPHTLQCWSETFRSFGHAVPREALQQRSGMDGHDMLRELLPAVADDVRKEILKFQGKAFRTNYLSRVAPFPQVQPLFKAIKELGLKVGVATDCTADELRIYLERAGGHKQIDARACGDDVNRGKPHPDLLQHVLSMLSLSPRDMLYVGDTPYDVKAAQSLGIAAIGVTTGCFDAAALGSEGASFVVRGVGDLLASVPGFAEHAPEL